MGRGYWIFQVDAHPFSKMGERSLPHNVTSVSVVLGALICDVTISTCTRTRFTSRFVLLWFSFEKILEDIKTRLITRMANVFLDKTVSASPFSTKESSSRDWRFGSLRAFYLTRKPENDAKRSTHVDPSDMSFNVCLGKDFTGSRVYFHQVWNQFSATSTVCVCMHLFISLSTGKWFSSRSVPSVFMIVVASSGLINWFQCSKQEIFISHFVFSGTCWFEPVLGFDQCVCQWSFFRDLFVLPRSWFDKFSKIFCCSIAARISARSRTRGRTCVAASRSRLRGVWALFVGRWAQDWRCTF